MKRGAANEVEGPGVNWTSPVSLPLSTHCLPACRESSGTKEGSRGSREQTSFILAGPYLPATIFSGRVPQDSAGLGPERTHACRLGVQAVSEQSFKIPQNQAPQKSSEEPPGPQNQPQQSPTRSMPTSLCLTQILPVL